MMRTCTRGRSGFCVVAVGGVVVAFVVVGVPEVALVGQEVGESSFEAVEPGHGFFEAAREIDEGRVEFLVGAFGVELRLFETFEA